MEHRQDPGDTWVEAHGDAGAGGGREEAAAEVLGKDGDGLKLGEEGRGRGKWGEGFGPHLRMGVTRNPSGMINHKTKM